MILNKFCVQFSMIYNKNHFIAIWYITLDKETFFQALDFRTMDKF